MSKYELKKMKLGDVEGQGYAYKRKTVFGKARKGIFYADDEEELEKLKDEDEIEFEGTLYFRDRPRDKSFPAKITNITPTRQGQRADFVDTDNPEELKPDEDEE